MDIRSGCPINLSVEVLGDKWSLVVLRDVMFGNLRTYRDLHGHSLDRAWRAIDEGLDRAVMAGDRLVLLVTGHAPKGQPPVH